MSQPETSVSLPDPVPRLSPMAGFLSYLVPGLGQIVQGRYSKGIFFMVILLGMFHAGQAMADWKAVYLPIVIDQGPQGEPVRRNLNPFGSIINYRWHFAGQFFIGASAWPALWQFFDMPVPSAETSPFWHEYQKEPLYREKQYLLDRLDNRPFPPVREPSPEGKLNRTLVGGDKTWDIGWIYTVIAGVLNILVIYDAVAGPAFGVRRIVKTPEKPQTEAASS